MTIYKRTKIIATLGPASNNYDTVMKLVKEGVDVCRINFSHGDKQTQSQAVNTVHGINKSNQTHIALLADLQGPKIRVGEIENDSVILSNDKTIIISTQKCIGNNNKISVDYPNLALEVDINDRIMIDDGKLILKTIKTNKKDEILAKVIHGGVLSSRKGINLPDTNISQSSLSEKDKSDLAFVMENYFQWIALSFVRNANDIVELRKEISKYHKKKTPLLIAKIEKPEALDDLDNIIAEADGIMVARGDLGIEIPMENVPLIQKMIVKKCLAAAKPIIIATQMMESMISSFTPTRAEVNDVANSVMDGADAVMLSGETSVGKFPVEVIRNVRKIISQVESYEGIFNKFYLPENKFSERYISSFICNNACILAEQVKAKALISMTYSGHSAIELSSHRPRSPIYVFTNNHNLLSKLSLVWGVKGFYYNQFESTNQTVDDVKTFLKNLDYIKDGDILINLTSMPISEKGKINTIRLSTV